MPLEASAKPHLMPAVAQPPAIVIANQLRSSLRPRRGWPSGPPGARRSRRFIDSAAAELAIRPLSDTDPVAARRGMARFFAASCLISSMLPRRRRSGTIFARSSSP